jgi:hypothetical protein
VHLLSIQPKGHLNTVANTSVCLLRELTDGIETLTLSNADAKSLTESSSEQVDSPLKESTSILLTLRLFGVARERMRLLAGEEGEMVMVCSQASSIIGTHQTPEDDELIFLREETSDEMDFLDIILKCGSWTAEQILVELVKR